MEDTFVLKIQLGNNVMQTGNDVADALRTTADKIAGDFPARYGSVVDSNGNSIGEWEIQ